MAIAVPKSATPIRLKMRGDLTANLQQYQGVEYWIVKEPLGQKYYQFPPHVYFLLEQLDGKRSTDEIINNYHERYSPKRLDRDQLQHLLQRFHRDGLVISDLPGQGPELLARGKKNRRMEFFSKISNILAVRFRGVDPDRLLTRISPYTSWLFTRTAASIFLALAVVALVSVLANWAEFQARLPGFEQFFDWRKWYLFGAVLCFTKIFHEFGHGLSCKKFGGECHEIGFMLLVLTPCLYCNVSDSWRLPNKWQRAAIGAAGMYIEIILATIATFVWWFVQPGLVQEICLQIMLVSSVSTVLFNGNPLLRFDGYYIMSDVLEIPNLHQKSSTALNTLLGRHWLGLEMPDDPLLPRNRMLAFATFTVAAFLYRFFVLFSILMFLTHWLEPYGLETIGQGIAWFSLFGMLFWPAFKLYRFMSVPGRVMQMKPKRFGTVGLIALTVIGAILFVPFPSNLSCRAIIVPKNIEAVYAQVQGKVVELPIEEGKQVAAGDLLARLDSVELQLELERLQNELTSANEQLAAAQRLSLELDDASQGSKYIYELPTLKQQVTNLQEAIALKKSELAATTITSPIAGTVIAAPLTPNFPGQFETPLIDVQPVVSGNQHNIHLARGQRLCEIADLSSWQAVILLTERQVKFAEIGQTARIKLHAYPGTTLKSDLDVVWYSDPINVRSSKDETFDNLQAKARLPDPVRELVAKIDQESLQYLAVAPIDAEGLRLKIGMDGQCRLKMPNRSLAQRFWWWFNENFGT